MESIITIDIKSFLFLTDLLSDHQVGFRPGRSTLDTLFRLSQQIIEALNVRHEIRVISLDIWSSRYSLASCPALEALFVWHPRPTPLLGYWLPLLSQPTCGSQQNPFINFPCQGWSAPRQCSRPCNIHNLHQRSLLFFGKLSLSICRWLHLLPWHPSPFRQPAAASTFSSDLEINHKLVKHLEYVFQSWQISHSHELSLKKDCLANPPVYFLNSPLEEVQSLKLLGPTISHNVSCKKLADKASRRLGHLRHVM